MHCIENKDNTQNKFTSELFCYILLVFMSTVAVWWENYIKNPLLGISSQL